MTCEEIGSPNPTGIEPAAFGATIRRKALQCVAERGNTRIYKPNRPHGNNGPNVIGSVLHILEKSPERCESHSKGSAS